jgi:cell division cycle 20-like protein 1 (cofactor of APC complex)
LASGGGSADKSIRTWSSLNGASLSCTDAGSQVCNLVWSEGADELLSSHGYWSNEVALWRRGDMSRVAVLPGHSRRVVHLAVSPDGRTIVTGTGDEMLRFWSMCPGPRLRAGQQCFETASCLTRTIR